MKQLFFGWAFKTVEQTTKLDYFMMVVEGIVFGAIVASAVIAAEYFWRKWR